jgi:protein gp37
MAETTGIAWARSTFNPWIGCTRVGPGCDHCYAEAQDARKRWGGVTHWGAGVPRMRTSAANWKQPIAWNKKAAASGERWTVFCASLADVFDNEVPSEWRDDLFWLLMHTPNLEWLLVTKRIGNVARMWPGITSYPLPNVRIIITVCDQAEVDRDVPKLLALPGKNGISYEPALGPVDWRAWLPWKTRAYTGNPSIQWVIVGGESAQGGHPARPFFIDWARSTIRQCKAAGVPVFIKQIGSRPNWCSALALMDEADSVGITREPYCDLYEAGCIDRHCGRCSFQNNRAGADPAEWPADLRVRELPE